MGGFPPLTPTLCLVFALSVLTCDVRFFGLPLTDGRHSVYLWWGRDGSNVRLRGFNPTLGPTQLRPRITRKCEVSIPTRLTRAVRFQVAAQGRLSYTSIYMRRADVPTAIPFTVHIVFETSPEAAPVHSPIVVAEGEGFEPPVPRQRDAGFQDRCNRPLCHPSNTCWESAGLPAPASHIRMRGTPRTFVAFCRRPMCIQPISCLSQYVKDLICGAKVRKKSETSKYPLHFSPNINKNKRLPLCFSLDDSLREDMLSLK